MVGASCLICQRAVATSTPVLAPTQLLCCQPKCVLQCVLQPAQPSPCCTPACPVLLALTLASPTTPANKHDEVGRISAVANRCCKVQNTAPSRWGCWCCAVCVKPSSHNNKPCSTKQPPKVTTHQKALQHRNKNDDTTVHPCRKTVLMMIARHTTRAVTTGCRPGNVGSQPPAQQRSRVSQQHLQPATHAAQARLPPANKQGVVKRR